MPTSASTASNTAAEALAADSAAVSMALDSLANSSTFLLTSFSSELVPGTVTLLSTMRLLYGPEDTTLLE